MRSDLVVVTTPLFSQHLSLLQAVEDFPIQKLISELAIERFTVAVLPRTAWLNEQGLGADHL